MRTLSFLSGLVLSITVFVSSSVADISPFHENTTTAIVDNGTATRSVEFVAADFLGDALAKIKDIEVSITFSKLPSTALDVPYFNQISFTLDKVEVGTSSLITSGNAVPNAPPNVFTGSFTSGLFGDSFTGTLKFNTTALLPANFDPDSITAGTYLPAPPVAPTPPSGFETLTPFIGAKAVGIYTLTIGDNFAGSPLTVTNFRVTITAVPEPSSLAGLGLLATGAVLVRRRRAR